MRCVVLLAATFVAANSVSAQADMLCTPVAGGQQLCRNLSLDDQARMSGMSRSDWEALQRFADAGGGNRDAFLRQSVQRQMSAQAEADRINRERARPEEMSRNGGIVVLRGGL